MNYIVAAIPIFFILILLEFAIARMKRRSVYRLNDAIANVNCGLVQQLINVFMKGILLVPYVYLYEHWRLIRLPDSLWTWVVLFVLTDFLYYWFHRYAHEINLLWAAHVVHHQSEDYNLSVALRQSGFQNFFSTLFYLPLAVLGFNPVAFVTINSLQTLYQFWIHTELVGKLPGWFEYIFCTPSHHRVHHGRNPEYIDKNHGGTFIIWDRLFGTFEPEVRPVVYGVTKPLRDWNPVWANFDYFKDLWQQVKAMPTVWDKLRLWWARPGWRPEALGGQLSVPEVSRGEVQKFDAAPGGLRSVYVAFQFLILLGLSVYFLYRFEDVPAMQRYAGLVLILFSAGMIGMQTNGRRVAWMLEVVRFPALLVYAYWLVAL